MKNVPQPLPLAVAGAGALAPSPSPRAAEAAGVSVAKVGPAAGWTAAGAAAGGGVAGVAGVVAAVIASGRGGTMAKPLPSSSMALASRTLRSALPITRLMMRTPPRLAVAAMEKPAAW